MTPAAQAAPVHATQACRRALANAQANYAALHVSQAWLTPSGGALPGGLEWVLGRDGALTVLDPAGHWWSGCSVPRATAARLLGGLELADTTGFFLFPDHPAQVRFALDRLSPSKALIVLLPDHASLAVLLHCEDLSADLSAGRLWLLAGEDWPEQLRTLLRGNPGLPTPMQLVRTALLAQERWDGAVPVAERVFAEENGRRSDLIRRLAADARPGTPARCIGLLAPSRFVLWDDASSVLADVIAQAAADRSLGVERLDPDRPASASRLALAQMAAGCDILFAANTMRQSLAGVLPCNLPLVTWLTSPRIPPCASAGPRDRLLLADPAWVERAVAAGWPRDRLAAAGWPEVALPAPLASPLHIALIADTCPIGIDAERFELSSHRLLWETALRELTDDPGILDDPGAYARDRLQRLGIAPETFDIQRFNARLLLPAWQQSIARRIVAAGKPLRLHGAGWREIPDLCADAAGPIASRTELLSAASAASALVDLYPWMPSHPLHCLPRPLLDPHTLASRVPRSTPPLSPSLLALATDD